MPTAVAIDTSALDRFQAGFDVEIDWFTDWGKKGLPSSVLRIEIGEVVYFLGPDADTGSKLLVVKIDSREMFLGLAAKLRPEAFLRLVRVGRSAHSPGTLPLPTSWSPYHTGSLLSIQANHSSTGERARIEIDLCPKSTPHTFAYCLDRSKRNLNHVSIDYQVFDSAVSQFEEAVLKKLEQEEAAADETESPTMTLTELDDRVSMGRSLDDWLNGKLTKVQRSFVDSPMQRSIRLVGAAGTGKTLSLIVKCLFEFSRRGHAPDGYRCLYLTHNQSTVETATTAIAAMDQGRFTTRWPRSLLKICTLQELANEAMKYDLHGLEPLSSDGLEGRTLQIEAIESQIQEFRKGNWITFKARCSQEFRVGMEASSGTPQGRAFAFEIMNEFACVLEADGVRQSAERRERYLNDSRKTWMMPLPEITDRRVVLNLYDLFRDFLRAMGVIGADQMTADYLGFLDSNRWDNIRQREGFDAVFVDELHLFNRQERMTLHHLMRNASMVPLVVMAYDNKQSIRDSFYGLAETSNGTTVFARDMALGSTERFELTDGFRYTSEIAAVLEWIDQTFPAAGLSDELGADWKPLALGKLGGSGSRPVLYKAPSTQKIFDTVFPKAQRAARDLQKGRRVAVLCASETMFKRYSEAGKYREQFLVISDREQLANLRHAGKRYVFSMPEFVAGVQFDTVFLIEVNEGEVPQGPYSTGALRRYVSLIYLGASRAERRLELFSSDERGGPSRALRHAIEQNALDVLGITDV